MWKHLEDPTLGGVTLGELKFKMIQDKMEPRKKSMEEGPLDQNRVRKARIHGRMATQFILKFGLSYLNLFLFIYFLHLV